VGRERRKVAVLGATGAVGQRFVQLLASHPWFELAEVAASDRSAGRPYSEATRWLQPGGVPEQATGLSVLPAEPSAVRSGLVFSALGSEVAGEAEAAFRAAGRTVVSNAANFRMQDEVPLVIPEVNAEHLALVPSQRARHGGAVVTNPNCSTIGLCLALEPLRRSFGLKRVQVTTLQAISGAGYPGVSSMDILGNVLPEIAGEEEKLGREPAKIFGELAKVGVEPAELVVSVQCNRVAVRDGHLLSISVELCRPVGVEEAAEAFLAYRSPLSGLNLPSAPERPVLLIRESARPQPALDADACSGMAVTVGRLAPCPVLGLRFVALVHNTLRGAAGNTILIAELMVERGLL
jgi:aspartate-semialdehyde dehydrogenase